MNKKRNEKLRRAASKGRTAECLALLDQGAEIDALDRGCTALIAATQNGWTETCSALLDRGANIEGRDHEQWTALMAACALGNIKLCSLLLNRGADIHATNKLQRTAFDIAASWPHDDVRIALLAYGARPKPNRSPGSIERYPLAQLHYAAQFGDVRVLSKMLDEDEAPDLKKRVEDAAAVAKTASKDQAFRFLRAWLAATHAKAIVSELAGSRPARAQSAASP